jgi:hypothetical protein
MFSATLAAAGTGKLLILPFTLTMRPAEAEGDAGAAVALRLGLEELVAAVVAVLVVVIPALHAARDKLAAQAARATAAGRYLFIVFLKGCQPESVLRQT